jgi:hypothetical protein
MNFTLAVSTDMSQEMSGGRFPLPLRATESVACNYGTVPRPPQSPHLHSWAVLTPELDRRSAATSDLSPLQSNSSTARRRSICPPPMGKPTKGRRRNAQPLAPAAAAATASPRGGLPPLPRESRRKGMLHSSRGTCWEAYSNLYVLYLWKRIY